MAIINDIGFGNVQEQRERDRRWRDATQPMLDKMVRGETPVKAPWEDPRFQEMVIRALAKGGTYRRDSEKLAVIREVFGSKT
jgi:hypothetical protein